MNAINPNIVQWSAEFTLWQRCIHGKYKHAAIQVIANFLSYVISKLPSNAITWCIPIPMVRRALHLPMMHTCMHVHAELYVKWMSQGAINIIICTIILLIQCSVFYVYNILCSMYTCLGFEVQLKCVYGMRRALLCILYIVCMQCKGNATHASKYITHSICVHISWPICWPVYHS